MKILIISVLIVLSLSSPPQYPVIGIYTQSDTGDQPKSDHTIQPLKASNYSQIPASYVKFVQMSGAQVIPLFAYSNTSYFDNILPKLNGVLFPGGGIQINIKNKWTSNADYVLKYAMNQTKNGNPYPIWGTCLGMQLISYLTSGYDSNCLSSVHGESAIIKQLAIKTPSYLYDDLSASMKLKLQSSNGLMYFNHLWAVSTNYFNSSQKMKSFWNVASTTTSTSNEIFVSTLQAKEYPFYVTQFHPQKNLFEWKVNADRSDSGAEIVQILSNKFIEKARQNKNRFDSIEELNKVSIYNYKTQSTTQSYTQIYLFHQVQLSQNTKSLRTQ